ncbi:MAG: hypothetical protein KKF41_05510 [Actinobacteria bacterium]|nr:hypothetical protein [Actinomycetota bacterium]MBU1944103.1 hypothetical protein [Actinomycetota bacterium]MBU2687023.1 hypothetical protein [Actinomycetota bacterium]
MKRDEKQPEEMNKEEALREWKRGKRAELAPPPEGRRMSMFTLRLDSGTLQALVNIGEQEGVGPSVVARRILQEGVKRRGADVPFEVEAEHVLEHILKYGYKPPP